MEYFGKYSAHGKSVLIDDDLSVIGSYNWDMKSTYVDTETMLVIHGEGFYQELEDHIRNLSEEPLEVDKDGASYQTTQK